MNVQSSDQCAFYSELSNQDVWKIETLLKGFAVFFDQESKILRSEIEQP